jgi:hypothetical protein
MKMKWVLTGAAVLVLMTGCKKTENNATQSAPSSPNATTAPDQTAPGQTGSEQQANVPAAVPAPPPEPPKPFEIAAGRSIPVIPTDKLDSRVNKVGDDFRASLAASILVNGEEAIPKGATVRGVIVDAKKQGAIKGEANLAVRLTSITVRGKDYPISTSTYAATEKGKGKRSAVVTGGGAALGALIGGLAGGGRGAAIGAGVGGGGGLAASAGTGGQNVVFPAESRITFRLSKTITVDR